MMDQSQVKGLIAARVARELKDGDIVNLGIGLPTLIPSCLPQGVRLIIQSENGMIDTAPAPGPMDADPMHVVDAGGSPAAIRRGGCFIDSATSFSLIRGGHIDCTVLGALEVDAEGNLSNWIIPGKKVPGMGGAMDLVVGAEKVIVAMEHTAKGKHKILEKCLLPLTAVHCVDLIVTEMGVIEVTKEGLVLKEYNNEFTVEEIRAATGAELAIPGSLAVMR